MDAGILFSYFLLMFFGIVLRGGNVEGRGGPLGPMVIS